VTALQAALTAAGYDTNGTDGHFGRNTLEALLNFQEEKIGPAADDGIVGQATAALLGLSLPKLDGSAAVPGVAIPVPDVPGEPDARPVADNDADADRDDDGSAPRPAPVPDSPDDVDDLPEQAIELIKYFEASGDVTKFLPAYQDSVDVWTIGYGHTGLTHQDGTVHAGRRISAEKAEELLKLDLRKFTEAVNDLVTVDLTPEQYGALVSFSFNVGSPALRGSTLRRLLNAGSFEAAGNEFPRWCKAGGKKLLGLYRRRVAEQRLFQGKDWKKAKTIEKIPS
jgi:lysozyme